MQQGLLQFNPFKIIFASPLVYTSKLILRVPRMARPMVYFYDRHKKPDRKFCPPHFLQPNACRTQNAWSYHQCGASTLFLPYLRTETTMSLKIIISCKGDLRAIWVCMTCISGCGICFFLSTEPPPRLEHVSNANCRQYRKVWYFACVISKKTTLLYELGCLFCTDICLGKSIQFKIPSFCYELVIFFTEGFHIFFLVMSTTLTWTIRRHPLARTSGVSSTISKALSLAWKRRGRGSSATMAGTSSSTLTTISVTSKVFVSC